MFIDKGPQSVPLKYIIDSADESIVYFICRDVVRKLKESIDNMKTNKTGLYFNFDGGVSEITNNKQKIENVISSLRDFVKQEKDRVISVLALFLLESLNEYYSMCVGNGYQIKLLVFGHFRQIDADFYELTSILKEISQRESSLTKFLREHPIFCEYSEVRTWKDTFVTAVKPVKYVCGLAFRPVKYICCLVSQIFWQGTPEAVMEYKPSIRFKRSSYVLDWLSEDLDRYSEKLKEPKDLNEGVTFK